MGLILRVSAGNFLRELIKFNFQIFFNVLLPPIILNSGYELHQANFFRNIGAILTFAFAGTFLSAMVIGLIVWLYALLRIESLDLSFVDAISVGATLSATDPVTILAIFTTYKVDPKLYTIIFGESILNDAIAIVIFETAQQLKEPGASTGIFSLFEGIGIFLGVFFGSLLIGTIVGAMTALVLKYTYLRRYPKIESCLVFLIAYGSYFFSQGMHMSGIVSLLFTGITLKHYAYYNMSRRTQLSTKYIFQVLAQLSENFIFIYLGLSLFTDDELQFQPLFIIVTVIAVCTARWVAVFPLSKAINWVIRYRARRRGREAVEELPYSYQAMLFWAGLRGAVGVALAALLQGETKRALRATVLVVVVLTVIIFGGTTARMLEILGIRTGVVEELDSDDEFDIEAIGNTGSFYKRGSGGAVGGIGFNPRRTSSTVGLESVSGGGAAENESRSRHAPERSSTGNSYASRPKSLSRKNSRLSRAGAGGENVERSDLLGMSPNGGGGSSITDSDFGSDIDTSDLPPPARRVSSRRPSPLPPQTGQGSSTEYTPPRGSVEVSGGSGGGGARAAVVGAAATAGAMGTAAAGAIRTLLTTDDHAALFRQLDEDFIKPKLLLGGKGGVGTHSDSRGDGSGSGTNAGPS